MNESAKSNLSLSNASNASSTSGGQDGIWIDLISSLIIPAPAVVLNVAIVLISALTRAVSGDYKWFLANLALMDTVYCLEMMISRAYFIAVGPPIPDFACTVDGFFFMATSVGMILCMSPTAVNRYVKMYHVERYNSIFRIRNIFVICGLLDLFAFAYFGALLQVVAKFKTTSYPYCRLTIVMRHPLTFPYLGVAALLIIATYGSFAYCNFKMYKKIKMQETAVLSTRQRQRIQEVQQLLRATIAQALAPVFCQLPGIFIIVLKQFFTVSVVVEKLPIPIYLLNPLINALATLIMVKPYRTAFKALLRCKSPNVDVTTIGITMTGAPSTFGAKSQIKERIRIVSAMRHTENSHLPNALN